MAPGARNLPGKVFVSDSTFMHGEVYHIGEQAQLGWDVAKIVLAQNKIAKPSK